MLRITDGKGQVRLWPVDRSATLLGRLKVCDLRLDSEYVSKLHALLEKRSTGYYVKDLLSSAGTFVNGRRIDRPVRLDAGMTVQICDYSLTFVAIPDETDEVLDDGSTVLLTKELDEALSPVPGDLSGGRIEALLELSRNLGQSLQTEELLETAFPTLFRLFPQLEHAIVLLLGETSKSPVCRLARRRDGTDMPAAYSRTIMNRVMERKEVIVSRDPRFDFPEAASVQGLSASCMVCAPLIDSQGAPLGVIQLGMGADAGRFPAEDLNVAAAVGRQVGVAIETARLRRRLFREVTLEHEMMCARQVMMALLPPLRCQPTGYDCWSHYQPARHVGGDYLGCFPLPEPGDRPGVQPKRWALAVGDVAGKGMPAALFMARLSAEVRLVLREETDPARALDRLNKCLTEASGDELFVTFVLAVLDTEIHRLTVAGAGHYAPIVRRARDSSIEQIGAASFGPPLGCDPTSIHKGSAATLEPGDMVLLLTDGACDIMNAQGQHFRHSDLLNVVSRAPANPSAIGSAVLRSVAEFTGKSRQFDDIALLCLGRRP
jgi:serine phosphatase RsbU (regulator of sigma subunit)/pSer/pThr/pTyr-binding forkhead associated (FHA) protein